jgi:hypothetical protein
VRVVIPTQSIANTWTYYQARAVDGHKVRYLSPRAPRGDALPILYPVAESLGVVFCEGPMDALAAAECGFLSIAFMGCAPPDAVLAHAVSYAKMYAPAFLVADIDALPEATEIAKRFWSKGTRCALRPIYGYKDLAEMPLSIRHAFLHEVSDGYFVRLT